jgi:hypothetical protein
MKAVKGMRKASGCIHSICIDSRVFKELQNEMMTVHVEEAALLVYRKE